MERRRGGRRAMHAVRTVLLAAGLVLLAAGPTRAQEIGTGATAAGIESIRVEGNERIEADTVRSYMTVHPGDPFDPRAIDASLKSLFATGLFADVVISREGQTLVVRVLENPIINRVAFEGNDALSEDTLKAEVQLQPRMVYTRTRVQSDVQRLIEVYRRNGRFAATIEPKVIQLPQNRIDLVFEIDEGPKTGIEKISFIGNETFSDSELRDVIATKESAFWRIFSTADTYDPDRLTFDRELLRRFYLAHGYADFRVVSAVAELATDRKNFYVTFTVAEGKRYRVGAVNVVSHLRDLEPAAVEPLIRTPSGDWYNADEVENTIQAMTNAVGDLGYAFIDIEPKVKRNTENTTIDVTYEINEGPRVYVQRIEITGNSRTLDEVIRREFRFAEGDAFNAARFRRSEQRIQNLGYFAKVDTDVVPGDAPDQAVVKVNVEEQATGSVNLGAGFSTFEGPLVSFGIAEDNLLGRGQRIATSASISGRRVFVDLGFTEPYFLGREIEAGVDVFRTSTSFRRESSFDQAQLGTALRAGYPLSERWRQIVRYTVRQDEIENVKDTAARAIRDQEGSTVRSVFGTALIYDGLDNRNKPTEGDFAKLDLDAAGAGGTERWIRQQFKYDHYIPVTESWVLHFGAQQGYIVGVGKDVRIADRFFLGSSQLRGFATSGVGPRDAVTDDALGGNIFYTGTAELSVPLGISAELPISARFFTDAGSLFGIDESDPNIVDSSTPRVSVGIGFSYDSPLGPIGVDFAKAVRKESFDDTEIFRINFGTRF